MNHSLGINILSIDEKHAVTLAGNYARDGKPLDVALRESRYFASQRSVLWERIEAHAKQAYEAAK